MEVIIISSDIASVVFLVVLLFGTLFGTRDDNKSTLYFIGCLVTAVIGSVADAIGYMTVDPSSSGVGLIIAEVIAYVMCPVVFILFAFYFFSVIETKASVPKWAHYPVVLILVMDIILVLIGTVNKKMIYIENGVVMDGEWTDYTSMLMFLGILYLYYVLLSYRKALSLYQIIAFGGFLFFPIADSWITLFNADIDFTYPIIAVAFVVIYVIIQEHTVAEENMRKLVFEEDSLTDPQTGFKNRRAYDEAVNAKKRGRAKGVVYCNVNHLDEIREKDGPEAVDKYVLEFDGILKDSFSGADIFRISEKSFVAFLYKISEAALEKKAASFKDSMELNDSMAAVGYAYSEDALLFDMVRDAQLRM